MTQDEIIAMAQECNLVGMRPHLDGIYQEALETFAKLVAAHEREACAKAGEDEIKRIKPLYSVTAENIVKAIKARGQQ